ncbi:protein of unknown function DUF81 [Halorhodospira halochloris]|uniref:Probable membrane transporter protein n=1 Tax=Halorhodospira halochloris TaxID=1052 RepID=A0A110B183_HALHR|nr:sulfite exporter TauE/SafE family protein [Halorhodospira halochloris]MBK1650709.1 hypothetical protein [Halorhodospira halochloris]BAU56800.1 protein of unknown function DUF81 [Halorhodospira halochloris]
MLLLEMVLYLFIGTIAGASAGLFGIGGGIVIVPLLVGVFALQDIDSSVTMHLALGTSLATICFTSASSALTHYSLGSVSVRTVRKLAPAMICGAAVGVSAANYIGTELLKQLFGTFLLLIAITLVLEIRPSQSRAPSPGSHLLAGTSFGAISALLGVGGGTMSVPYLIWRGHHTHAAIGSSAACAVPFAGAAAVGYVFIGWGDEAIPAGSLGYVYLPALLGITLSSMLFSSLSARICHSISSRSLTYLFAFILASTGALMVLSN